MPMGDLQCPVCKSDSYLNPGIKLYISPCYHKMCEACLAYTFQSGQAPCPECGSVLRKVNYMTQTFEDLSVEKECRIRKMLRKFVRDRECFGTAEEYNDYLEDLEDKIAGILETEDPSQLIEEVKQQYRLSKKRDVVVEHANEKEAERSVFDWFLGMEFDEFRFCQRVRFLDFFKPENVFGGCLEETMAYKAYASLSDPLI